MITAFNALAYRLCMARLVWDLQTSRSDHDRKVVMPVLSPCFLTVIGEGDLPT